MVIKFRCRARVYSRPYAWLYSVTEMRMRLRPCTLGSWGTCHPFRSIPRHGNLVSIWLFKAVIFDQTIRFVLCLLGLSTAILNC